MVHSLGSSHADVYYGKDVPFGYVAFWKGAPKKVAETKSKTQGTTHMIRVVSGRSTITKQERT